jgi:hypothetical protein
MKNRKKTQAPDIRIEYPARGETYCHDEYGVYEYGEYPRSSVLSGRTRRNFLDTFTTLEEAQAKYPNAEIVIASGYQPDAMLDLPGEDD